MPKGAGDSAVESIVRVVIVVVEDDRAAAEPPGEQGQDEQGELQTTGHRDLLSAQDALAKSYGRALPGMPKVTGI
jgi:hypothetical protein